MCASVISAEIGGASLGAYSGQGATKLDSHANMAVAGNYCTIIATSGRYATVTPFSSNLPKLEMVEIGDVALAYNDPISLQTYLGNEKRVIDPNDGSLPDSTNFDMGSRSIRR